MNQTIRNGAYGIIVLNSDILLTQKKSGPYKGLWDLPGGGIEFGETPEKTLKRELTEEACIIPTQWEFLTIATSTSEYYHDSDIYRFHQIGILYKILDWKKESGMLPEEENQWFTLADIPTEKLTPFALHAISILPRKEVGRPSNKI